MTPPSRDRRASSRTAQDNVICTVRSALFCILTEIHIYFMLIVASATLNCQPLCAGIPAICFSIEAFVSVILHICAYFLQNRLKLQGTFPPIVAAQHILHIYRKARLLPSGGKHGRRRVGFHMYSQSRRLGAAAFDEAVSRRKQKNHNRLTEKAVMVSCRTDYSACSPPFILSSACSMASKVSTEISCSILQASSSAVCSSTPRLISTCVSTLWRS